MSTRVQTNTALRMEKGALRTVEHYDVVEEFGMYVFNEKTMREKLPKSTYKQFQAARNNGTPISDELADQFATTLKEWALSLGVTHYTHQFQPMTGTTAEKHDSFLEPSSSGGVIMEFNGDLLKMGEPDASSFPSGGIRETHSARGYTAWDRNSYPYVRVSPNGGTLVIPTAFVSWTGDALDYKTPLLRATDHLCSVGVKFMKLLGYEGVDRVYSTLGIEQEYFIIDRGYYLSRPDLQSCGRTLIGDTPPRGQQLDDHYFGVIPPRVLAFMQECEQALWRLGMPCKTRHNEVAPGQFETAPIFEEASIASDHNHLQMEIMADVAQRHGLRFLIHEKPFAGLNGSGKHHNWSMASNTGVNFLEPGKNPSKNRLFLATLTACIRGVDVHADVLRAAIANPGNDFRLGANEAPPAIMSVFLGSDLDELVKSIIEGRPLTEPPSLEINLRATSLPTLTKHATDRNRTSPFAFTGNKFEFRAVGSAQSCAIPGAALNMIAADSLQYILDEINKATAGGETFDKAFDSVIRTTLTKHARVIFNGDGYSNEWLLEAEKRGLPNYRSAPEAIHQWCTPKNLALFAPILSEREMRARENVWLEQYAQAVDIEAKTLVNMVETSVLPAAFKYQESLARCLTTTQAVSKTPTTRMNQRLDEVVAHMEQLMVLTDELRRKDASWSDAHPEDLFQGACYMRDSVFPIINQVREVTDWLEARVPNELWPLPKYDEMLLLK